MWRFVSKQGQPQPHIQSKARILSPQTVKWSIAYCPNFDLYWVTKLKDCSSFPHAGKLLGHLFTIVDVVVNEKDQQLMSLSTARVRDAVCFSYFLLPQNDDNSNLTSCEVLIRI